MPVDPGSTTGTAISLSGDAGCLGCLAIVGIPALVIWRTKRRLFGTDQPPLDHVWHRRADAGPVPGVAALQAADASFSEEGFAAGVTAVFVELMRSPSGDDAFVAAPSVVSAIAERPRRAVLLHGSLLSASSEGGEDVVTAAVSGVLTYGPVWWRHWEERWTFTRATPVHGASPTNCRVCGAALDRVAEGCCTYCGNPAPGPIDTWRLTRREPLGRPLFL